jgi:hypothetical protein
VDDEEKVTSCAVVAPRDETSTAPTNPRQILGCTKQAKMMAPSASVGRKVAVDATRLGRAACPRRSVPRRCQFYFSICVHIDKYTAVTRLSLWLHRSLRVTKNTDAPTPLKWWETRSVSGNSTDTIFRPSPGSRVVSWISPILLALLNVCSQSQVKWTLPVGNLCLRTP